VSENYYCISVFRLRNVVGAVVLGGSGLQLWQCLQSTKGYYSLDTFCDTRLNKCASKQLQTVNLLGRRFDICVTVKCIECDTIVKQLSDNVSRFSNFYFSSNSEENLMQVIIFAIMNSSHRGSFVKVD